MPLLYKYISPERCKDGTPLPLLVLKTMRLNATDPRSFNDPFEVRPWFDQERHDHAAGTEESFHKQMLGIDDPFIKKQSMVGFPTENALGFGEQFNKRFRDDIGKKFRVLCLNKTPKSVLMWGHYTRSHAGIVLGMDTCNLGFCSGLKSDGFEVKYSEDRSATKLPLAFYQSPHVERYDFNGNIVNHLDEEVLSDGGLFIPFREYRRQVEAAGITALTTKAQDWHYEQEVRFIYDLSKHAHEVFCENGRHLVSIPFEGLREIIIGFQADVQLVREIVRLYREGKIGKPKLFFSACHPNCYEVVPHQASDQYLLDYFEIILPSM